MNRKWQKKVDRERMEKFFRVIVGKLYNLLMLLSLDLVFKFDIHSFYVLLCCSLLGFTLSFNSRDGEEKIMTGKLWVFWTFFICIQH